jgi:hypothetical protein
VRLPTYGFVLLAALLCLIAAAAPAADYLFSFGPGGAKLNLDRDDNKTAFGSMLELLRDFHGNHGFRFVLSGSDAPHCEAQSDCGALFMKRVQAVIDAIDAQPDDRKLSNDVEWRRGNGEPGAAEQQDSLQLRIAVLGSRSVSPRCPFLLEINDPRLPSSDGHQDWLNISGLGEVYITSAAQIRVRGADSSGVLAVKQWQARDLLAGNDTAEVPIGALATGPDLPRKRDVGEALDTWPTSAAQDEARRLAECTLHFILRPSRYDKH